MKHLFVLALIFTVSANFAGCKQKTKDSSDLNTLENFALNKDVRINACSAPADQLDKRDPRSKIAAFIEMTDVAKAKLISAELILALTAVPDEALKIFQAQNGKIFITEDAPRYCSFAGALRFNGETPIFQSCLVDIPFGSGTTPMQKGLEGKTLVSIPDAKAIRHGIVRTMGYMIAEAFEEDPGFSKLKVELTKSFLTDVANSPVFTLDAHEALLGRGIDAIVRKNISAEVDNLLAGSSATNGSVFNFMNFVVGESFDSFYCRTGGGALFDEKTAARIAKPEDAPIFAYLTDTRLVMKYFFPRTYATFLLVEAHMKGYAGTLPKVDFKGSTKISGSGASLTENEDESTQFGLQEGTSIGQRKTELEAQIREHANNTRFAYEQFQERKSTYDNSWTDVWGSKESEMKTAKAVYNSTVFREQALLKDLRAVEAEEKKLGASGQSQVNNAYAKQDLNVAKFDANAELAKGVQNTAKGYGESTSKYAGKAGKYVAGDVGEAFGNGLGDGVGGVLGAFGKNTTDAIQGVQTKVADTRKFATDLAVDPTGTLYKAGKDKLTAAGETINEVGKFGGEVFTGDYNAVLGRGDKLLSSAPVAGTLYQTSKNVYNYSKASNPQDAQAAIDAQYKTAGEGISNVQNALVAKGMKSLDKYNPMEQASKYVRTQTIGGINNFRNDLILHPPGTSEFSKLRETVSMVRNVEKVAEYGSKGVEYIEKSKATSPSGAMEGLQQQVPGHANSGMPPVNIARPIPSRTESNLMVMPSMVSNAPRLQTAPMASAPRPMSAPVQSAPVSAPVSRPATGTSSGGFR